MRKNIKYEATLDHYPENENLTKLHDFHNVVEIEYSEKDDVYYVHVCDDRIKDHWRTYSFKEVEK